MAGTTENKSLEIKSGAIGVPCQVSAWYKFVQSVTSNVEFEKDSEEAFEATRLILQLGSCVGPSVLIPKMETPKLEIHPGRGLYLTLNFDLPLTDEVKEEKKIHVTLIWMGDRSTSGFELAADLKRLAHYIRTIGERGVALQFREEAVFGKPAEIAAGTGLLVRKCAIYVPSIEFTVPDMLWSAVLRGELDLLHAKWYKHESGESNDRLYGVQYHVTVGQAAAMRGTPYHRQIAALTTVRCTTICLNQIKNPTPLWTLSLHK